MTEKRLIAAARRGDVNAFNQLVIAYQQIAYSVAYRIMGNADAAADATQDAFLSAYRAVERFRGGSFKAWILRIVTNACYDQWRRERRRPSSSLEDLLPEDLDHSEWVQDPGETPEEHLLRRELGQILQDAIESLPTYQRTAIVLADVQGMGYEEVAQAMSTSLGTVKSRISRGRAKVRDYLRERRELLPVDLRLNDE